MRIDIAGQRDVLVLRERLQLVVGLVVIGHHPLSEALDLVARPLFLRELAELDFGHSARRGLGDERLIGHLFCARVLLGLLPFRERRRGRERDGDGRRKHDISHNEPPCA